MGGIWASELWPELLHTATREKDRPYIILFFNPALNVNDYCDREHINQLNLGVAAKIYSL